MPWRWAIAVISYIVYSYDQDKVWGLRFTVAPDKVEWTRSYLAERETGYDAVTALFYPVDKDMVQTGEATELQVRHVGFCVHLVLGFLLYRSLLSFA